MLQSVWSSSASPICWEILRQALQWRIQKSRVAASGEDSDSSLFIMGWPKMVGLKSMP